MKVGDLVTLKRDLTYYRQFGGGVFKIKEFSPYDHFVMVVTKSFLNPKPDGVEQSVPYKQGDGWSFPGDILELLTTPIYNIEDICDNLEKLIQDGKK